MKEELLYLLEFRDHYPSVPKAAPAYPQKYGLQFHGGAHFPLESPPSYCVFPLCVGNQVGKPGVVSRLEQKGKVVTEETGIVPGSFPGEHQLDYESS